MKVEKKIQEIVFQEVQRSPHQIYREPLVGFADSADPLFLRLKQAVSHDHLLPEDLLPGAKSVVAFFLPFSEEIFAANRKAKFVAREWAIAYIETNKLITEICGKLKEALLAEGIQTSFAAPTHNFDQERLISYWSHRHVAYIAGLGTFGHNHLLITEKGCGGRYGSIVIDKELRPKQRVEKEYCLRKRGEVCNECINLCPAKALKEEGFDRQRCYRWVCAVDRFFSDLETCDVCGKCSLGPCAIGIPKGFTG